MSLGVLYHLSAEHTEAIWIRPTCGWLLSYESFWDAPRHSYIV